MLGYQQASYVTFDARRRPAGRRRRRSPLDRPTQPRTVVLTSKACGHQGGNDLTAQLVDPHANNSPLRRRALADNAITVSLATNATGAITSTAAQVIAAINAHPAASALVDREQVPHQRRPTASSWPSDVSPLSDLLRAPADDPARPAGPVHAPHRQGARRLEGRRVPLLPGARQRDRDLGRLPRDRGAARAQLRDRPRDDGARRQPRHLHPAADQRRRRDALAV